MRKGKEHMPGLAKYKFCLLLQPASTCLFLRVFHPSVNLFKAMGHLNLSIILVVVVVLSSNSTSTYWGGGVNCWWHSNLYFFLQQSQALLCFLPLGANADEGYPCSMSYRNSVMDKTDLPACSLQWTHIAKGDGEKKYYEREEMLSPHKKILKNVRLFPSKSDRETKWTLPKHTNHIPCKVAGQW